MFIVISILKDCVDTSILFDSETHKPIINLINYYKSCKLLFLFDYLIIL